MGSPSFDDCVGQASNSSLNLEDFSSAPLFVSKSLKRSDCSSVYPAKLTSDWSKTTPTSFGASVTERTETTDTDYCDFHASSSSFADTSKVRYIGYGDHRNSNIREVIGAGAVDKIDENSLPSDLESCSSCSSSSYVKKKKKKQASKGRKKKKEKKASKKKDKTMKQKKQDDGDTGNSASMDGAETKNVGPVKTAGRASICVTASTELSYKNTVHEQEESRRATVEQRKGRSDSSSKGETLSNSVPKQEQSALALDQQVKEDEQCDLKPTDRITIGAKKSWGDQCKKAEESKFSPAPKQQFIALQAEPVSETISQGVPTSVSAIKNLWLQRDQATAQSSSFFSPPSTPSFQKFGRRASVASASIPCFDLTAVAPKSSSQPSIASNLSFQRFARRSSVSTLAPATSLSKTLKDVIPTPTTSSADFSHARTTATGFSSQFNSPTSNVPNTVNQDITADQQPVTKSTSFHKFARRASVSGCSSTTVPWQKPISTAYSPAVRNVKSSHVSDVQTPSPKAVSNAPAPAATTTMQTTTMQGHHPPSTHHSPKKTIFLVHVDDQMNAILASRQKTQPNNKTSTAVQELEGFVSLKDRMKAFQ